MAVDTEANRIQPNPTTKKETERDKMAEMAVKKEATKWEKRDRMGHKKGVSRLRSKWRGNGTIEKQSGNNYRRLAECGIMGTHIRKGHMNSCPAVTF